MDDVRVLLDEYAEPAELAAVEKVLERTRIPGQVEGGYRKPKPGERGARATNRSGSSS